MILGPGVGFGSMEHVDGSHDPQALYDATLNFLKCGGRALDCAECYETTAHVGRAISESGIPRAQLHVTTKLAGLPGSSFAAVRRRLEQHLNELGLTRVDLLLIHWPGPAASPDGSFSKAKTIELLSDSAALEAACSWQYFDEHIDAAVRLCYSSRSYCMRARIECCVRVTRLPSRSGRTCAGSVTKGSAHESA